MLASPSPKAALAPTPTAAAAALQDETPIKDNTTTSAAEGGTGNNGTTTTMTPKNTVTTTPAATTTTTAAEPIVTVTTTLNDTLPPSVTASSQTNNDSFRSNDTMEYYSTGSERSFVNSNNNNSNSTGTTNKLERLQSNLMRSQHSRDPMKIYQIVEILGEGSMGRVCRVHKRKTAVGGSARPEFVRQQQGCCFWLLDWLPKHLFGSQRSKFLDTSTPNDNAPEPGTSTMGTAAQEIQTSNFFAATTSTSSAAAGSNSKQPPPQLRPPSHHTASARSVSTFTSVGEDEEACFSSGDAAVAEVSGHVGLALSSGTGTTQNSSGGRKFAAAKQVSQQKTKRDRRRLYKKKSSLRRDLAQAKEVSYALKSIHLNRCTSPLLVQELKNEVDILRTLDHPNIVRAIETFDYRHRLYIVLELCQGGDLYTREPYAETLAHSIASQVTSAIAYLHSRGIVHRDLKFENIMFVNSKTNDIKLIDFGLSQKFASDEHLHDQVGTVYTMAPELLAGDYTSQADIWSLGVICFMLLSSSMPFYGHNRVSVIKKIIKGKYKYSARRWSKLSSESRSFVSACLTMDPDERPTAAECLHLKWLEMDFSDLSKRRTVKHCNPSPRKHLEAQPEGGSNDKGQDVVLSGTSTTAEATAQALEELDQMDQIQSSILAFATYSRLKKLALLIVAYKSTTEEIGYLKQMFDKFDLEHDGEISESEFGRVLQEHYDYTDHEVNVMFQGIDVDGTGKVHYSEFLAATLEAHGHVLDEDRLAEAFDRLDSDDSGYITLQNLREFLGTDVPDFYLKGIIDEADIEGDQRISYEEFIQQWEDEDDQNEIMSYVKSSVASRHLTPSHSIVSSISDEERISNHSGVVLKKNLDSQQILEQMETQIQYEHEQKQPEDAAADDADELEGQTKQNSSSSQHPSYRKSTSAPPVMSDAMESTTCFKTQKALSVRNAWV